MANVLGVQDGATIKSLVQSVNSEYIAVAKKNGKNSDCISVKLD